MLAATCRSTEEAPARGTGSPSPSATASQPVSPTGPLAGETWPAGTIRPNALLHDDGRRLWQITLAGDRRLIWNHPKARVARIAVSAGGRELALTVALPSNRGRQPSFVLYLLEADGAVETVDVVRSFRIIDSPIFLTPPTERRSGARLYWLRVGEEVDELGRLDTQVMVLTDDGPREVEVPLRYAEAPFDVHGYPGAHVFTLALFRQNDVPTRLEILRNDDFSRSTDASLTLWGDNEFRANTDIFVGVAWPTPIDYVVPVANEVTPERYELRLFRSGCEYLGYRVVYAGQDIDWGYSDLPWQILPGGADQVLVLGAKDVSAILDHDADSTPWLAVDLATGRLSRTGAVWEQGPWAWVSAEPRHYPSPRDSSCARGDWIWD
jgi:hypothetical protein